MNDTPQAASYLIRIYNQLTVYQGLSEAVEKLLFQDDTKVQRVIEKQYQSLLVLASIALEQQDSFQSQDLDSFLHYIKHFHPNVAKILEELEEEEPRAIDEPLPICFGDGVKE